MKNNIFLSIAFVLAVASCQKSEVRLAPATVQISKMHNLCASAPGASMKSSRSGPDFVYGDISSGAEGEVAYYSSSEPSAIEDMRVEKVPADDIAVEGIEVYREKFSDGREAILLTGYAGGIDRKPKVEVRYAFDGKNKWSRDLAEALASTTQICKA